MLAYAGRRSLAIQALEINAELSAALRLLHATVESKARLVLELGEGLPPVGADRFQLRQVVTNLVLNALDAMEGKRGTLTLRTESVRLEAPQQRAVWRRRGQLRESDGQRYRRLAFGPKHASACSSRSFRRKGPGAGWAWPPPPASCERTAAGSASTGRRRKGPASASCCRSRRSRCHAEPALPQRRMRGVRGPQHSAHRRRARGALGDGQNAERARPSGHDRGQRPARARAPRSSSRMPSTSSSST